jgi:hypothetical protein
MDGLRAATPPSAAVLGERKYPVVFAEPTIGQVGECADDDAWLRTHARWTRRAWATRARAPLHSPPSSASRRPSHRASHTPL